MKRIALIAAAASLIAFTSTAFAQDDVGGERPTALGVGVQGFLITGGAGGFSTGPSVTFQTPVFHIEGILTFVDDDATDTDVTLGGRFWYALSQTGRSDFSIGGGLALLIDGDDMGDDDTDVEIDLGAQLRAFIVPNVALSATLGFAIILEDGEDDFIGLVGDLVGDLGITYFF